jgi:monoamine oxidase
MYFEGTRRDWLFAWAWLMALGCAPAGPPKVPLERRARRASVVVVGGGFSGLAAAYALMKAGHEVTVLEGSDRPGGRILTLRAPFRDGLYVEAGATHIVGDPALVALCAELGVVIERRPRPRGLAHVTLYRGERVVTPSDAEPPREHVFSDVEESLGEEGRMAKYFAEAESYDPTGPVPEALRALDGLSGAEFLRRKGASPGFVASMDGMLGLGDTGLEEMSALFLVHTWAEMQREIALGGGGRIAGGCDRLSAALAGKLGVRVAYGARVARVEQDARGVHVRYERRGANATVSADRAVLALPPKVLRRVATNPELSREKVTALDAVGLESVARVFFETSERFWLARGESGRVDSDSPLGPVRDETELEPGTAGVLGLYASRAAAKRLSAMSEEDRVRTALAHVESGQPGTTAHLVTSVSHCWDTDPFALGGYAFFTKGQVEGVLPHLGRAEGRLHFAGDHTSHRPGFLHGALASAERVVTEISAAGDP